jgi:hypothetical protein
MQAYFVTEERIQGNSSYCDGGGNFTKWYSHFGKWESLVTASEIILDLIQRSLVGAFVRPGAQERTLDVHFFVAIILYTVNFPICSISFHP